MPYIDILVNVPIEENGEIHKRLLRLAEQDDSTLEAELAFAVNYGINHHIRQNLDLLENA